VGDHNTTLATTNTIIIIIIIIIVISITFIQTIYNYTPETNHVSKV